MDKAMEAHAKLEPLSDISRRETHFVRSFENMLNDVTKDDQATGRGRKSFEKSDVEKDDYVKLRIQINIVEDMLAARLDIFKEEYDARMKEKEEYENNSSNDRKKVDDKLNKAEKAFQRKLEYVKDHIIPDGQESTMELVLTAKKFLETNLDQQLLEDDDKIWPHQEGLPGLGPFGFVDLPQPNEYLLVEKNGEKYSLNEVAYLIDGMEQYRGAEAITSKPYKISVNKELQKAWNIPKNVTHYRWFFPLEHKEAELASDEVDWADEVESPLHVLAKYGGFVYFHSETVVSAKGVLFGDDLFFDGPYFIPNPDAFTTLKDKMRAVTLQPLLDQDAIKFAWIMEENERAALFKSEKDFIETEWAFRGAFIYEYDNTKEYKDENRRNYFQLLTSADLKIKTQKNVNNAVMHKIKLLIDQHKGEWESREDKNREKQVLSGMMYLSGRMSQQGLKKVNYFCCF